MAAAARASLAREIGSHGAPLKDSAGILFSCSIWSIFRASTSVTRRDRQANLHRVPTLKIGPLQSPTYFIPTDRITLWRTEAPQYHQACSSIYQTAG